MRAVSEVEVGASRLVVGRGPLAVEQALVEAVLASCDEAAARPELLARPVVVVVPSRSLRLHVCAVLAAARGRALAGVQVTTLHGLASAILERSGEQAAGSVDLLPIIVRRLARSEPALAPLAPLRDGYGAVVASVVDLLDAGLEPAHVDALVERLGELRDDAEAERAAALVRVAGRSHAALRERVLNGDVLRRAAPLLAADPDRLLPARLVVVHGFAEATGVASDLLETIARTRRTLVLLDRPADPTDSSVEDQGARFTWRLADRLRPHVGPEDVASQARPSARVELICAQGSHAEARELALRLRALLDAGEAAERIGVVARDLEPYRLALALHFGRLAIPFSGLAARGAAGPAARRIGALLALLRDGGQAGVDAWITAASGRRALSLDVGVGLRARGVGRLAQVAGLDPARAVDHAGSVPLPVRTGIRSAEAGDGQPSWSAGRRRLSQAALASAVLRASALVSRFDEWPQQAPVARHLERLRALLVRDLGWDPAAPDSVEVLSRLAGLEHGAGELALSRNELVLLLERELEAIGRGPLGGAGGGVQVLTVVEARGRTWRHLFLLGVDRELFPRPVHEDALLPDRLRAGLLPLLPDLPVKSAGHDEERYLFAQLLSAAPEVTVSWQESDDDGRPRGASPLVERLRLSGAGATATARDALSAAVDGEYARAAHERALVAALEGPRSALADRFAAALEPALPADLDGRAVAAARVAVLDELDPDLGSATGRRLRGSPGPFLGFVGARAVPAGRLAVTQLEALATCPWQAFLARILRLEPPPDPLGALPALDALLVGTTVHAVLEAIVARSAGPLPATLEEAFARLPAWVSWPQPEALAGIVDETCRRILDEAGVPLRGLAAALAERVRPYLEVAARLWEAAGVPVVGTEVEGQAAIAGPQAPQVWFRADLVERGSRGVRLTDFKTGRPAWRTKRSEAGRRNGLLEAVARGEMLQGGAYLSAAGARASARYLWLHPDLDEDLRETVLESSDGELLQAFRAAATCVLESWTAGVFFPRLLTPDGRSEPLRCRTCEVAGACLRHDSGVRARLAAVAAVDAADDAAWAAMTRLWRLGAKPSRSGR